MDYQKTYEQYQKYGKGKKFEEHPDYNRYKKEQGWYEKVKSKRTGSFYQAEDLIKRELVPEDWQPRTKVNGTPVQYPLKTVNEIYRIRLVDGSEWLKSRQMWKGLDTAGNEIDLAMNDKKMYDCGRPQYSRKPEDPKDKSRDAKLVQTIDRVEKEIKYTLPFSPDEAQRLYDMKNGQRCNLVIVDSSDHPPVTVPSFEHFKSTPFEELWEMVTTPKYKLDRNYGDNLDNSHIG
jgi:hypothetical protein